MNNTNENRFNNKYFGQNQYNRYDNKFENVINRQYFNQNIIDYENQNFINRTFAQNFAFPQNVRIFDQYDKNKEIIFPFKSNYASYNLKT